jgi:hypothetical protein
MTPEEFQAARALVDAATPGPWWPRYGGEPGEVYASAAQRHVATVHGEGSDARPNPDSKFIAAARSLVPRLLDALEQAQAEQHRCVKRKSGYWSCEYEGCCVDGTCCTCCYHADEQRERAEAAVVEARKAALREAAEAIVAEAYAAPYGTKNRGAAIMTRDWLRARADAQGSTP